MSSHQNLSVRLISNLIVFLLPFMYHFCQYLLRKTKICFSISTRCTNMVTINHFPKLAKLPGLSREIPGSPDLGTLSNWRQLTLRNAAAIWCKRLKISQILGLIANAYCILRENKKRITIEEVSLAFFSLRECIQLLHSQDIEVNVSLLFQQIL